MTLEESIEPSYLLTGAPSMSNSSSLSLDAEIILGREGVNLRA